MLFKNKYLIKFRKTKAVDLIIIYRYISLFITSYFYVTAVSQHSFARKAFIVSGMTVTSVIMNYLYKQNQGDKQKVILLILIETLGNTLLLIPSGGIQSPYIWYVLNTVLVSAIEIGSSFSWLNMGVYLASLIGTNFIYDVRPLMHRHLLFSDVNVMLGITLVTGAVQIFVAYAKEIEEKSRELMTVNNQLHESNQKVEETLAYVMKIYEVIHLFSSQNNSKSLIDLILEYTTEVLKTEGALFIKIEEQKGYCIYFRQMDKGEAYTLFKEVIKEYKENNTQELNVNQTAYTAVGIKYAHKTFGILAVRRIEEIEKLSVIVQLSGMLFQRFMLEEMNDLLIVEQEQNRIASEIHDSVLQKLFALSCNLFTIARSAEKMKTLEIIQQINVSRTSVNHAMKELRETIYGLSAAKGGSDSFKDKLDSYIKEIEALHSIKIELDIEGEHRQLTIKQQSALYRMICEGIANAVKHGRATLIQIMLSVSTEEIKMTIKDNGMGFDTNLVRGEDTLGLGLKNMQYLTASLGGELTIQSSKEEGTLLELSVIAKDGESRRIEIV